MISRKSVRIASFFAFSLILLCASARSAADQRIVLRGRPAAPFFDGEGRLSLGFRELYGNFGWIRADSGLTKIASTLDFTGYGDDRCLEIKKDRLNRVWAIWEEGSEDRGDIFLGRADAGSADPGVNISADFPGRNYAPSLDITPVLQAWAAWVNHGRSGDSLIALDVDLGRSWIVAESALGSIASPKVLAAGDGKIWVFWTGVLKGLDEILFSFYDGSAWSEPSSLSRSPSVPSFHPAAALDGEGNPWVAWTSFDGDDYEIYLSSWDGSRFRSAEKVTENITIADGEPSLCFFQNGIPLIAWSQAAGSKKQILMTAKTRQGWTAPLNLSRGYERSEKPVLISEGGQIAVSWKAGRDLCLEPIAFSEILRSRGLRAGEPPPPFSSPLRHGSRFIAFGDSITYGWIDPLGDVKDKGYPPRLELLLANLFPEPFVYNEGLPGEPTWQGVSRLASAVNMYFALYLLLMEGTNDVTNESYSMDTTAFNLKQMALKCVQYGVFPLLSTIIPRKGDRWTTSAKARTLSLNDKIRALASSLPVLLVDNYESFINYPAASGGWETLIADPPDNLHPSENGYQWMAETWYRKVLLIPFSPVDIKAALMVRAGLIELSWKNDPKILAGTKLASYKIYRKAEDEGVFTAIAVVNSPLTGYQDKAISTKKGYTYLLSSVNSDKVEGPLSEPVNPVRGDPYAPQNVAVKTLRNRGLFYAEHINQVSWQTNPQNQGNFTITKYRIYRKQKGEEDARFEFIGEVASSILQFLDRKITRRSIAESYVYGIAAVDSSGIEGEIGKSPD